VTGWSYTALGQADRWFKWGFFFAGFIIASFIVGLPWGAYGVAVSYSAATYLILLPSFWYCFRTSHLRSMDIFKTVWRPAFASIIASLLTMSGSSMVDVSLSLFPHIVVAGLTFLLFYIGIWVVLPGGRSYLQWIWSIVTNVAQTYPTK